MNAPSITGPWTYRGLLTGSGKYSFTIHPGIAEFKGDWYLFYHVGTLNGVIGVIGPTRMPYDKVIALVTHTSQLVTDLLD